MKTILLINALVKFLSGLVILSLLLFLPAGTIAFLGAWRLIALLFIPMFIFGIVLFFKSPALLEKRLNNKETSNVQKKVILLSGLEFIVCFIVAGFDYRFGWSELPSWIIMTACIIFVISYGLYVEVTRENEYLSRTVEVQENQKVVSTGLYGIVRHPMYFAVVLLFWSMPLVIGSFYSFIIMLPFPLLLISRIKDEEKILEDGLPGYKEYEQKVKYHLFPFIW
ncbi:MAG: isoprenylcysteine carboxylmethyltransferase family protein [Firmicutes bacterium]|nr:isoprenylcysteine carboxylmethyltransferase family protein [Candidatus Colivicinus equi]